MFHTNLLNRMRTLAYFFLYLSIALFLTSCSGQVDEGSLPVLSVSSEVIDRAEDQTAVFTVTYNGQDVTSAASVQLVEDSGAVPLSSAVFTPETAGTYMFVASYDGKMSNNVTVKVVDSTPVVVESAYNRHVCVVEFTGAWCINCPYGYDLIYEKLSLPSNRKYKETMHLCAFHSDEEGRDDNAIPETQDVFDLCDGLIAESLQYPSFCVDFHTAGILTDDGIGSFIPAIKASHEQYPAHCGVAVSSKLNADGTQASVTARIASELTSDYRMIILVIENMIKGWQKTTLYPEGQEDYIHSHVVRKVVTAYTGTFTGEKLSDSALIKSGEEAVKTWTVDVESDWVLENTQIYAIALDSNGRANNMNLCAIDGGDSGYDLKNK